MSIEEQSESSTELEGQTTEQVEGQSGNTPGETEESLLSVVQSVSQKGEAQQSEGTPESPTGSQEGSEGQTEAEGSEAGQDAKADEFADVPFNKHPRFKELIREKNSLKAKVAEIEPDAQQFRQIQTFMDSNALTPQEVAEGLMLMAEMKSGDPKKAYDALQKQLDNLALVAGKKLPEELESRVEQGFIDRETALDLHEKQVVAERNAAKAEQALNARAQQDGQATVNAMAGAVQAWEAATRATDPDFDIKAELVKDRVRAHMAVHGMPKSAAEALKVSKDAYDTISATLRKAQGTKQPMRTAVGGKVNGSPSPEPRSLLDVVRRAAAGA